MELAKVQKDIHGIIDAIKAGMFQPSMKEAMDALEARKAELTNLLAESPPDAPDMLPSAGRLYAKRVARLTDALNMPEDRVEASEALRGLIEKIVLRPGTGRSELEATLYCDLGNILAWIERQEAKRPGKPNTPIVRTTMGVSVSVVAGTGFEPVTFRL